MAKKPDLEARVLAPSEYPANITSPSFPGAYPPKVIFAARHPLGLYHVEDEGANVHGVYFTPRRAKKARRIGTATSMAGAFRRISKHEDELIHPRRSASKASAGPSRSTRSASAPASPSRRVSSIASWTRGSRSTATEPDAPEAWRSRALAVPGKAGRHRHRDQGDPAPRRDRRQSLHRPRMLGCHAVLWLARGPSAQEDRGTDAAHRRVTRWISGCPATHLPPTVSFRYLAGSADWRTVRTRKWA